MKSRSDAAAIAIGPPTDRAGCTEQPRRQRRPHGSEVGATGRYPFYDCLFEKLSTALCRSPSVQILTSADIPGGYLSLRPPADQLHFGDQLDPELALNFSACQVHQSTYIFSLAPPRLTMKLPWRSEICAWPTCLPLSPAASTNLPAKSPGGLRNIEPELGNPTVGCFFVCRPTHGLATDFVRVSFAQTQTDPSDHSPRRQMRIAIAESHLFASEHNRSSLCSCRQTVRRLSRIPTHRLPRS